MSRQVANLVDLGLVDRTADPVDGRAQVLTPSAEGTARLARDPERPARPLGGRPRRLAAEDVARLAELLRGSTARGGPRGRGAGGRPAAADAVGGHATLRESL